MIDTADITETTDTADIVVMMTIDVMSIAAGGRIIAAGTMIIGIIGAATITKMSVNAALSSAKTHPRDLGHRIRGVGEALTRTSSPLFSILSIATNAGALSADAAEPCCA